MNKAPTLQQTKLNCKVPIIVLSMASLVFTLLSSIRYFVEYYSSWGTGGDIDSVRFRFPRSIGEIIGLIVNVILPALLMGLFIIYIFAFYKKQRAKALMPIITVVLAVIPIIEVAFQFLFVIGYYRFVIDNSVLGLLIQSFIYGVPFVLVTISALKGFNKKILLVVGIVVVLLLETLNFTPCLSWGGLIEFWIEQEMHIIYLCYISKFLGIVSFYLVLLLFGLKNRIPAIISQKTKVTSSPKNDPAYALKTLKDELEMGIITQEEYRSRRAEILSKL